jgi:hypothetical protein
VRQRATEFPDWSANRRKDEDLLQTDSLKNSDSQS